jgi:hypothetical protein
MATSRALNGLASIFVFAAVGSWARAEDQNLSVAQAGTPRTLFSWHESKCSRNFIPDAPAHMFRRADGKLVLMASHYDNWSMVGSSFYNLKPNCTAVMPSASYQPERYGKLWIEATYTSDGKNIIGVASQDMTEVTKSSGCDPHGMPGRCWLNNLVAVKSHDMGQSFAPVFGHSGVVGSLATTYDDSLTNRFGVFTISNIVANGGAFYAIVYQQDRDAHTTGNCLIRTPDVTNPTLWRGWDGADFGATLIPTDGSAAKRCKVIGAGRLTGEVRSLNFVPKRGVWIAAFQARLKLAGDNTPVPGAYISTSTNLIDWTPPVRIMTAPLRPRIDDANRFINYVSILDPSSTSRNFETIDSDRPVLLFTNEHLKGGQGSMDRDLDYVPLRLQ